MLPHAMYLIPLTLSLSSPSVVGIVTVLLLTLLTFTLSRIKGKRNAFAPYPPGPKGLPLIQNLLDFPAEEEFLTFADWGRKYGPGPVFHAMVLGEHIVILNSYDAVIDLFEKRSLIYSGRRQAGMVNDLMGWGYLTSGLQPGERLQAHRTMIHRHLQASVVRKYETQENRAVFRLLKNLLHSPENFLKHIRNAAVSSILMIAYGYEVKSDNDIYVKTGEEGLKWVVKAATPGTYMVDYIPWLKYVPAWFPGTQWKVDARVGREISLKMLYALYGITKEKILRGVNIPCVMTYMLEDNEMKMRKTPDSQLNEQWHAEALATLYIAGSDTTVSVPPSAILAVVLNHSILKKAQEEIDRVVGAYRLPTLADRHSLPYLEGVLREALRCNPVGPLGVPHRCDQEDIYNGYRIPAKSIVIANVWAFMRDPTQYPDPHIFRPERWLDSNGHLLADHLSPRHPNKALFGFGRRICPGRHLAEDLMFLMIANIFAVFDIEKAKDEFGQPITPAGTYSSAKFLNHPDPFVCTIKPRSLAAESLIREAFESIT